MTSLLPSSTKRTAADVERDLATRRPLVLLAVLGGVAAAASTLVVCLGIAVVGWFLTDAGAHGAPSGALRVGALGWLTGHGSGVRIEGVAVTAVPLGITLLAAWAVWRLGQRVGRLDLRARARRRRRRRRGARLDGAGRARPVHRRVRRHRGRHRHPGRHPGHRPERRRGWCSGRCCSAWASGDRRSPSARDGRRSGRRTCRPWSRAAGHGCRRILQLWLGVAALAFVVALVVDFGTAANVMSQLHTDAGDAALLTVLSLSVVPNAVAWSGAYLLGPGFTVGAGTLVTPNAVVARPAADVPDAGRAARRRRHPRLDAVAGRAAGAGRRSSAPPGPSAGTRRPAGRRARCAGAPAAYSPGSRSVSSPPLAGGAVGPGRMRDVGPLAFDVLVHAITAFGIGGLLGGLAMTFWARRTARRAERRARLDCGPCPPLDTRAARRARLRWRHQPPGAARRLRRPGVRRHGGRRRRRPRRHRGPGPGRAGRRPDVRAPGQGPRRPGGVGRRAWPAPSPSTSPTWWCSAGFMKLVGAEFLAPVRRPDRQHPPGAVARRSPACTARPTRSPTASRSPAPRCSWSTRASTPARSSPRPPCRWRTTTRRVAARADQGRRAGDARRHRGPDGPRGLHDHRQEGPVRTVTARPQRPHPDQARPGLGLRQDRPRGPGPRPARRRRRAGLDRRLRRADRGPRPPGHQGRGPHRLPRVPRRPGQDAAPAGARRDPRRPPPRDPRRSSSPSSGSSRSTWSSPTSTRSPQTVDLRRRARRVRRADRHRRAVDGPGRGQEPPVGRDRHLARPLRRRARGRRRRRVHARASASGSPPRRSCTPRRTTSPWRPGWATC